MYLPVISSSKEVVNINNIQPNKDHFILEVNVLYKYITFILLICQAFYIARNANFEMMIILPLSYLYDVRMVLAYPLIVYQI